MGNEKKIIIALDGISEKEAVRIAGTLMGHVWGFKINDLLFQNIQIIGKLKKFGNVFADAKLYDIPNTVANSVKRLSAAGADLITVHASGGVGMMMAAKKSAGRSRIIAVTILTSKDENKKEVIRLAQDALKAKVDGIVCSGHNLVTIKQMRRLKSLLKIVPGIRPRGYKKEDDQKQTTTPEEAFRLGADYLIIGRPILKSRYPLKTLHDINPCGLGN